MYARLDLLGDAGGDVEVTGLLFQVGAGHDGFFQGCGRCDHYLKDPERYL